MPTQPQAFLDLENALRDRFNGAWTRRFKELSSRLEEALDEDDYDAADEIVDEINLLPVVDDVQKYFATIALAAVLLGASRVTPQQDPRESRFSLEYPQELLRIIQAQTKEMLAVNAALSLKDYGHKLVNELRNKPYFEDASRGISRYTPAPVDLNVPRDELLRPAPVPPPVVTRPRPSIEVPGIKPKSPTPLLDRALKLPEAEGLAPSKAIRIFLTLAGKDYFALIASLHVSRLSAYGFLQEAQDRDVKYYRIDATLDARTCPLCAAMDGKVFPVAAGMALADHIMSASSPMALKLIAPFFGTKKADIAALKDYGMDEMIEEGLQLPPYHPYCRCIIVPTDERPSFADLSPSDSSSRIAMASAALYGPENTEQLFRNLFGLPDYGGLASNDEYDQLAEALAKSNQSLATDDVKNKNPTKTARNFWSWIRDLRSK